MSRSGRYFGGLQAIFRQYSHTPPAGFNVETTDLYRELGSSRTGEAKSERKKDRVVTCCRDHDDRKSESHELYYVPPSRRGIVI